MHLFMTLHFNNITQHNERHYSKLQQFHPVFHAYLQLQFVSGCQQM